MFNLLKPRNAALRGIAALGTMARLIKSLLMEMEGFFRNVVLRMAVSQLDYQIQPTKGK